MPGTTTLYIYIYLVSDVGVDPLVLLDRIAYSYFHTVSGCGLGGVVACVVGIRHNFGVGRANRHVVYCFTVQTLAYFQGSRKTYKVGRGRRDTCIRWRESAELIHNIILFVL